MSTLHVHIDESGDFNFSIHGSKYYLFTAAWTYHPQELAHALISLRCELNKGGADLSRFHASTDQQIHRNRVVNILATHHSWWFASIVIEKCKVNPVIRQPETFYPKFLNSILLFIFRGNLKPNTSKVLIYTDRVPADAKKKIVSKSVTDLCKRTLGELPFCVMHHPSDSNAWLQVADYCSWSVCRKWENNDSRTYSVLKAHLLKTELDAMRIGDGTVYY